MRVIHIFNLGVYALYVGIASIVVYLILPGRESTVVWPKSLLQIEKELVHLLPKSPSPSCFSNFRNITRLKVVALCEEDLGYANRLIKALKDLYAGKILEVKDRVADDSPGSFLPGEIKSDFIVNLNTISFFSNDKNYYNEQPDDYSCSFFWVQPIIVKYWETDGFEIMLSEGMCNSDDPITIVEHLSKSKSDDLETYYIFIKSTAKIEDIVEQNPKSTCDKNTQKSKVELNAYLSLPYLYMTEKNIASIYIPRNLNTDDGFAEAAVWDVLSSTWYKPLSEEIKNNFADRYIFSFWLLSDLPEDVCNDNEFSVCGFKNSEYKKNSPAATTRILNGGTLLKWDFFNHLYLPYLAPLINPLRLVVDFNLESQIVHASGLHAAGKREESYAEISKSDTANIRNILDRFTIGGPIIIEGTNKEPRIINFGYYFNPARQVKLVDENGHIHNRINVEEWGTISFSTSEPSIHPPKKVIELDFNQYKEAASGWVTKLREFVGLPNSIADYMKNASFYHKGVYIWTFSGSNNESSSIILSVSTPSNTAITDWEAQRIYRLWGHQYLAKTIENLKQFRELMDRVDTLHVPRYQQDVMKNILTHLSCSINLFKGLPCAGQILDVSENATTFQLAFQQARVAYRDSSELVLDPKGTPDAHFREELRTALYLPTAVPFVIIFLIEFLRIILKSRRICVFLKSFVKSRKSATVVTNN